MLQILERCFSFLRPRRSAEARASTAQQPATTVLLVRVPLRSKQQPLRTSSLEPAPPPDAPDVSTARHARPVGVRKPKTPNPGRTPVDTLRKLGIFPLPITRKLSRLGVQTVSDFIDADPSDLAERMGARRYAGKLRRRQRAIRFSRRFSRMTPLEALLLHATHRRSRAALAADSPAVLRRDLQRLLLSSAGQRLAGDYHVPEITRVRLWISEAKIGLSRQPGACASRLGPGV